MKTDRFEKTIRQKLESISPDFQESDWAKMQNYMHTHTPPTFWQQYGSWLGYAAAASVTTVMAFVYTNQLSQNNQLRADIKGLQSQIETIRQQPVVKPRTDTVYIVRTETAPSTKHAYDSGFADEQINHEEKSNKRSYDTRTKEQGSLTTNAASEPSAAEYAGTLKNARTPDDNRPSGTSESAPETLNPGKETAVAQNKSLLNTGSKTTDPSSIVERSGTGQSTFSGSGRSRNNPVSVSDLANMPSVIKSAAGVKTLGASFEQVSSKTPLNYSPSEVAMQSALMNRMSPKQIRKTWMAVTAKNYQATVSDKKTTQVTQAETVIPQFNIKLPYRFGAGMDWQKGASGKAITGEIIIAKKLSVSTGVTWMKLKEMEFITEKIFRDANKRDFKQLNTEVPRAFVLTNIKVAPSLVQVPLAVAFRNDLKDNWAYYAGTGINITLNAKEAISYNCLVPNPREGVLTQSFERKMNISPINSANFSFGIEKSWHPIVIQAEGYLYTYFKQLNPIYQRSGPGVKVKLLYQIGKKI